MRTFGLTRPTTCDEPTSRGRCQEHPTGGYNPLRFCACHLALYRERIRATHKPTPIGAAAPMFVLDFGEE